MARVITSQPVYLVDFSVYKPPEELRMNVEQALQSAKSWSTYNEEMKPFYMRVLAKSGLSPTGTYLPAAIHPCIAKEPVNSIPMALEEARMVMVGAVSDLLEKTGTKPCEIDILVTNCSIFCPTPSLSSMLINHFKFRKNIQSYNMGGMGCSNGVIGVNLIRDILQARLGAKALFVPAEITTYCFYPGVDRMYTIANCIFRMGGAAILFSNQAALKGRSKYQLMHSERVHTGADSGAYACMAWQPDPAGVNGVYLGRDVPLHAGTALKDCLTAVAPMVMTWQQYGEAAYNAFEKAVLGRDVASYVPDFTATIVKHYAIHAGGYAVLMGVQKAMKLPNVMMLPSFAALREYGNTSCSTTWYVMAYQETCLTVNKGDVTMQIGLGGGMKAGINLWRALKDNRCTHPAWQHLKESPLTEADLPRAIEKEHPPVAADKEASEQLAQPVEVGQVPEEAAGQLEEQVEVVQVNQEAAEKLIKQMDACKEAAKDGMGRRPVYAVDMYAIPKSFQEGTVQG